MAEAIEGPKIRSIPEIDGLRAIAIIQVVFFHIYIYIKYKTGYANNIDENNILVLFAKNGHQGVELFFVISGFIIALPYIKGRALQIGDFYKKRLVRILPPYYITLIIFLTLYLLQHQKDQQQIFDQFLASITFLSNLILGKATSTNPVGWSLEVEIQFYLLLPLITLLLKLKNNTVYILLLAIIAIGPILNYSLATKELYPSLLNYIHFFFLGILIAKLYIAKQAISFGVITELVIASSALLCMFILDFSSIQRIYLHLILLFILFYLTLNSDFLKKIFGNKILATIGVLSFSIYLIHYQLIAIFGEFIFNHFLIAQNPFNVGISIFSILCVISLGSYMFYVMVERMLMNLFKMK